MFRNRTDAGQQLAKVVTFENAQAALVLGLPRGGLPLAVEVATAHQAGLNVILAKKIGHPLNPEYAIGAVAEGGQPMYNPLELDKVDAEWLKQQVEDIKQQMAKRRRQYQAVLDEKSFLGQEVMLVDDGIATGLTMFAAIAALKQHQPRRITVAVPVIESEVYRLLAKLVDEVFAVTVTDRFLGSVGAYYETFPQVSDLEVENLLKKYG